MPLLRGPQKESQVSGHTVRAKGVLNEWPACLRKTVPEVTTELTAVLDTHVRPIWQPLNQNSLQLKVRVNQS